MPAPDLELAQLQDMQVNAVAGGGLSLMLAEVLPMAGRVSEWVSQATSGFVICYYDDGVPRDYRLHYQEGNLGNIVHELTHVAVNEAYGLDFVNHRVAAPADMPDREYDDRGRATNEEARQGKYLRNVPIEEKTGLLQTLTAWANLAELTDAQRAEIQAKFMYGMGKPHIECDTVLNQVLVWLEEWGYPQADMVDGKKPIVNALYEETERAVLRAHNDRTAG